MRTATDDGDAGGNGHRQKIPRLRQQMNVEKEQRERDVRGIGGDRNQNEPQRSQHREPHPHHRTGQATNDPEDIHRTERHNQARNEPRVLPATKARIRTTAVRTAKSACIPICNPAKTGVNGDRCTVTSIELPRRPTSIESSIAEPAVRRFGDRSRVRWIRPPPARGWRGTAWSGSA